MSNLVVVAIPDENDRVWKVSSEEIPHLTLLFLGDVDEVSNTDQIVQFVEHAANTTLKRFHLPVDRRGELGDDKADVLFFKKGRYDFKAVYDFRSQLLKDDNIKTAYDSTMQHEGPWLPHLTLGYPATPAKPETDDWGGGFYGVEFNKIAVWFGDFDGPEFLLKDYWDEFEALESVPLDVAMSGIMRQGVDEYTLNLDMGEAFLAHYGVKGMRWGVRKKDSSDETKRAGIQRYLDPQGHELGDDVVKSAIGVIFPVVQPLTWPANIRMYRAGGRAAKAKLLDSQEKKFAKNAMSPKNFAAIHNGSLEQTNRSIDAINAKYPEPNKSPATRKKYDDEVLKAMQDGYKASANSLTNKAQTMHLDVEFRNDGQDFKIHARQGAPTPLPHRVEHAASDIADEEITVEITGKIKRNAEGHVVGFEFDHLDSVKHSVDLAIEFLEHHGVKGMHWGVRKEDISKAAGSGTSALARKVSEIDKFARDVHFESQTKSRVDEQGGELGSKAQDLVIDAAHKPFKKDLEAINAKPEHAKGRKFSHRFLHPLSKDAKAYRKEVRAAYIQRLETEANKMKNASGTREYTIRERGGDLPKSKYYWEVSTREARHADGKDFTLVEVLMDADGFITGTKTVSAEDSMAQSMELGVEFIASLGISTEGLEHYGVKGMRWGVRNQRPAPLAVAPMARSRVPHGNKRKTKIDVEGGQNHEAHEDAIKVAEARAKLKKSGVAALSNDDLQKMQKRLNLEMQVAQLTSNRGRKFITRQLEQQGQQTVQAGRANVARKIVKKGGKAAGVAALLI